MEDVEAAENKDFPKSGPKRKTGPDAFAHPSPPGPPGELRATWLDRWIASFREHFAANRQALTTIPPAIMLAAATLLIAPAAIGFAARAYIGGPHIQLDPQLGLEDTDLVTALRWNGSDTALVVGTRGGKVLSYDLSGELSNGNVGSPIIDLQPGFSDAPVPEILARSQLSDNPAGLLGQGAAYGIETCLSGFVWREATEADIVCVEPQSRDQAWADRAIVEAQGTIDTSQPLTCPEGQVARLARPDDRACVTREIAVQTAEENRVDQRNKILPDAARDSTLWVVLGTGPAGSFDFGSGLIAAAGGQAIAGWHWGSVDAFDDVLILARQLGASELYGSGSGGGLYAIDAAQIAAGESSSQYQRQLGSHGSDIVAIATAAEPGSGMPALATAATDRSVKVWWPDQVSPSQALQLQPASDDAGMLSGNPAELVRVNGDAPIDQTNTLLADVAPIPTDVAAEALAVDATMPGSRWTEIARVAGGAPISWATSPSADGAQLVAVAANGGLVIADMDPTSPTQAGERFLGFGRPLAIALNGERSAGFDPTTSSLNLYSGLFDRLEREIPVDAAPTATLFDVTGERLVIALPDGRVEIMPTTAGGSIALALPAPPRSIAFNPSGSQIALGLEDGSVALLSSTDGKTLALFPAMQSDDTTKTKGPVAPSVRFNASGRSLLLIDTQTAQRSTYSIRLRRQSEWTPIGTGDLEAVAVSSDGTRFAGLRNGTGLAIFDMQTGLELGSIDAPGATTWAMSGDASEIALLLPDGSLRLFGEEPDPSRPGPMPPLAKDGLRLSADGSTLLLREPGGALHLWDVGDPAGSRLIIDPALSGISAATAELAPDGSFVIAADHSGSVELIELGQSRRISLVGHGHLVHRMALSGDGRYLATASLDGQVQITDLARARQVGSWPLASMPWSAPTEAIAARSLGSETPIDPFFQSQLNSLGYGPVPEDGVLGLATRAAIFRWQADNGLPPTGLPNEDFTHAIGELQQAVTAN